MNIRWKPLLFGSIWVLALSALLLGCGPGGPPVEEAADTPVVAALAVEAVRISKGSLFRSVKASGIVSGINEALVVSETQGISRSVYFEIGDRVETGQVLLQVDDTIAKLNLEQARQQLETAQLELDALESFLAKGNASKLEVIRARSSVSGAQSRFKSAQKTLKDTSIRAPIAGYISQREAALGNYMAPGTPIARIVDISSLKLEVSVGEAQIGLIAPGAAVRVFIPAASGQKDFDARVDAVAAGSDPLTGSFQVVISWANTSSNDIKAGMSAQADISTRQTDPVLIAPAAGVAEKDGETVVYKVVDDVTAVTPVRPGRRMGSVVEILDGLQEGDVVAVSGLTSLRQGTLVNPRVIGNSGDLK